MEKKDLQKVLKECEKGWLPPGQMTLTEWADKYRFLSPESSSEHGKYRSSRTPYMVGIMDAVSDPEIADVVVQKSSQIGYTEFLTNCLGYFIERAPAPMLMIMPDLNIAESFSLDRFSAMIRDTPILRNKLAPQKRGSDKNTRMYKKFPGGHLTFVGANAPSGLASRPIKILLFDEVDRMPLSSGGKDGEGDPITLALKRSTTFYDRKAVYGGTPTVKGVSRIESLFENSDKRFYFMPCPHCKHAFKFEWHLVIWPEGDPERAKIRCPECGKDVSERQRQKMISLGKWKATAASKVAGFFLNELYSPWVTPAKMAAAFLIAKKRPETLQVFVNTSLGETWEDKALTVDASGLLTRVERYPAEVPAGVLLITAGVDIQADRIEILFVGHGLEGEAWIIKPLVLTGDPTRLEVWQRLDDQLATRFEHEKGYKLPVAGVCIDSGYLTSQVYAYCKGKFARRVFCIKGVTGAKPLVGRPSGKRSAKFPKLFPIGVDNGKDTLFSRLKIAEPGPGYIHYPDNLPPDFFTQLTNEKMVTRYVKGQPTRVWIKKSKSGGRNEILDMFIYSLAALAILNPKMDRIKERVADALAKKGEIPVEKEPLIPEKADDAPTIEEKIGEKTADSAPQYQRKGRSGRGRGRGGFVNKY